MGWVFAALLAALLLVVALRLRAARAGRVLREDILKHVLRCGQESREASEESAAGHLGVAGRQIRQAVSGMESDGLLHSRGGRLVLTGEGRKSAMRILRAHRLWETYLAWEARMPIPKLHAPAEQAEHRLTPGQVAELDAALGHPPLDPHGEPIPTADGALPAPAPAPMAEADEAVLLPLSALKTGEEAEVVALDPRIQGLTRRRLLDLGLTPQARVSAHLGNAFGDPTAYRVRGTTVALRNEQAGHIWVRRLAQEAPRL